jgi:NADH:ubiquinone oxidoreductase subunit E
MSRLDTTQVSEFCLEGRFIDFVMKDGYKLKGLILTTSEGEFYVKLAKNLRAAFNLQLPRGTWLQIVGVKKQDMQTGEVKFKAEAVMAARGAVEQVNKGEYIGEKAPKKVSILVCQKSDCMKRGGKQVCQILEQVLSDRNLQEQVTIKGTGCMKNCKGGPNLVMPDKTRYSGIKAAQVPTVISKHFTENSENRGEVTISVPSLLETLS